VPSLNPDHISVTSTLDSGVTVTFDIPHSEADDEIEEVTAYEILSGAAGA
jgi:hypothetical protein